MEWYPNHVRVRLFNELTGQKEEITFPKKMVALIENPFYAVMNAPNSTMQQLVRKLALLDVVDEQAGSGKLDMIIQLPYVIKSPARREQAEQRFRRQLLTVDIAVQSQCHGQRARELLQNEDREQERKGLKECAQIFADTVLFYARRLYCHE